MKLQMVCPEEVALKGKEKFKERLQKINWKELIISHGHLMKVL